MTNKGSCHCKKVTFEFEGDVKAGMTCNCSHCHVKGVVLHFVPKAQVGIMGEDNLTTYTFNKNIIQHQFCSTCGVQPFGFATNDGVEMMAINLRTVQGIDIDALEIQKYNGKDL